MKNIYVKTQSAIIVNVVLIRYAQLLANDKSHKEIAAETGINLRTIEARWQRCKTLFKVKTKPGLVAFLLKEGLITILVLFSMAVNAQRVLIDPITKDTTLLPCNCPATIRTYKPPGNVNRAPVAIVTDNISLYIQAPITLALDASCSYDPEGGVLRFVWRKVSGPDATLTDTNKAICYLSNTQLGTYTFEVRVVDPLNAFVAKNIVVIVKL